jgi:signal transduction histidine kinase
MRYLSERLNWALFGLGVMLLIVLGFSADYITTRLATSQGWVSHTYEVQGAINQLRTDVLTAESDRLTYIFADFNRVARCRQAMERLPGHLQDLKRLTADNPSQQQRIQQLAPLLDQRVALISRSLALRESGAADSEPQKSLTAAGEGTTDQIAVLLGAMENEESTLLRGREVVSQGTYEEARLVLIAAFAVAILLLFVTFRQVVIQLRDRRRAEAAVRALSGRLLQLQDAERRKVARELHDSIGQYFAGLGMTLDMLKQPGLTAERSERLFADCSDMVAQGAAETRTLSHLLHPPLLDEAGFASAAKWYVEGYRERSKINVTLELPSEVTRMPKDVELALFRVLQEGLTNIHRHSGSNSAAIRVSDDSAQVTLVLQDFGKGMPAAMLEQFRKTSTGSGIGLAGMRERIAELGGTLNIESTARGTTLRVWVPLPRMAASGEPRSGDAPNQAEEPILNTEESGEPPHLSLAVLPA